MDIETVTLLNDTYEVCVDTIKEAAEELNEIMQLPESDETEGLFGMIFINALKDELEDRR